MSALEHASSFDTILFVLRLIVRGIKFTFLLLLLAFVTNLFRKVYLHPLSSYPGPKLWAASRLPWIHYSLKGKTVFKLHELHKKYGPVVRIAPNELSYTAPGVWKQVYGHRANGEMPKDYGGSGLIIGAKRSRSILNSDRENHARMRRLVSHAFSERALRDQEGYLKLYVDKLMDGLRRASADGPQDVVTWYNWTTFDIIGDLAFGEPFGCLDRTTEHPWVSMLFKSIRILPWVQLLTYYRLIGYAKYIVSKSVLAARERTTKYAEDKVERRLAKDEDRKDFLSFILKADDGKGMTRGEIHSNSSLFIIGGSETTATLLSGATYCLLKNKDKYDKLVNEIRGRFKNENDINVQTAGELKYMLAVLDEALRFYPPAPSSIPRVVPAPGEMIEGGWVPGGTTVGIPQLSINRSAANFHNPDSFVPERWLPEVNTDPSSPYFKDDRIAMQPFSVGPRNCIGRSLAYAEMRLILARLLFNFDLELAPGSRDQDWIAEQRVFFIWDKIPLMVNLTPVR